MKLKRRKANTVPILWTKAEEKLLITHLKKGHFDVHTLKQLFPKRTLSSIRSKVRKVRIIHDLFGYSYRNEKEAFTIKIAKKIKPNSVFDAYAGAGHQTFTWILFAQKVYACDIMESKRTQFDKTAKRHGFKKSKKNGIWHVYKKGSKQVWFFLGDAVDAAADIKVKKVNIDALDLDTCGSTLPTLPIILTLLKPRHLLITHGEFHSMRFKRQDVLRRLLMHRDIGNNPLPLEVEEMSNELDKAVRVASLRAHNETKDSFWPILKNETWLGSRFHGMLRRYYKIQKPPATSDCINELSR